MSTQGWPESPIPGKDPREAGRSREEVAGGRGSSWLEPHRLRLDRVASASQPESRESAGAGLLERCAATYRALMTHPQAYARLTALLVVLMVIFSSVPIYNNIIHRKNKDYDLWYRTGRTVLAGGDVYPRGPHLFPFMYPPAAASMLALVSAAGERAMVITLTLINSSAWATSILLSVWLATGSRRRAHPLLYAAPSLLVVPFIHDTYLLGQPNLLLLALMLGAFACLRIKRSASAGMLIALAASIKAFPVLAIGWLIYRRQWRATAACVLSLAVLLVVLPSVFRGPARAWDDLVVWTRGMVLKYDAGTIAQRPERSYSFKNQSLPALCNRLLRAIPADGESHTDWAVNVADLDFRAVNGVIVLSALALCGVFLWSLPRQALRTDRTDALEGGMLLLLIIMFSPLSFNYFYIWLIYPLTLALESIERAAEDSDERRAAKRALTAAVLLLAAALVMNKTAQAYGNLFLAALTLLVALAAITRRTWDVRAAARPARAAS